MPKRPRRLELGQIPGGWESESKRSASYREGLGPRPGERPKETLTIAGKKLLVLTAGRFQESVIITARDLGVMVVATDRNPDAPGLATADYAEIVDASDLDAILSIAHKHSVD